MDIKLIAMDVDGTLVGADHVQIPPRNVEAIGRARAMGVKIVIASGRTWSLLRDPLTRLGGADYAVISNGAVLMNAGTGERMWSQEMPNAQAVRVVEILHAYQLAFEVYCEGDNYVRVSERDYLRDNYLGQDFFAYFDTCTAWVPNLAEALAGRDVEKFNVAYVPREIRARVEGEIAGTGAPLMQANGLTDNMELAAWGVSKGAALRRLCESLGISPAEVMAFGDGGNDTDMLSYAGWSFAMENASEAAKQAARYLAPSHVEAGVGRMIEAHVLG